MQDITNLTRWHELFAYLQERIISPTGVLVQTNFDVSNMSPQLAYLPDRIRHNSSRHILIDQIHCINTRLMLRKP